MTKKIYRLSLALTLTTMGWLSAANAQIINRLPLKGTPSQERQVKALPFSGIDIITVADVDTVCLGFHVIPASSTSVPLKPDTALYIWLQSFVNQSYGSRVQSGGDRLLIVIKQLRLQFGVDSAGTDEYLKFTASAYRKAAGQDSVIHCADLDTLISGTGVSYQEELLSAFEQLFAKTNYKTSGSKLSYEHVIDRTPSAKTAAVVSRTEYNTGAYMSFEEFLQNRPSVTQVLSGLDEKTGKMKIYELMADSTQREITTCWGICITGELYVHDGDQLIPLELYNNSLVMSLYVPVVERKNQAMVWRRIVKRKNEAVKANARTQQQTTPYEVYPDVKLEGNIRATRLDLNTGKFDI